MDIKVLTEEEFNKIYPTYFEGKIKRERFIKIYSAYRHYLELYINDMLNLTSLNENIKQKGILLPNIYYNISNLHLNYVFLINNILLTNLSNDMLYDFEKLLEQKEETKIIDFIIKTFKNILDYDRTLVIGISVILDDKLETYLNQKCVEFTNILHIPVHIRNLNIDVEKDRLELLKKYPKYLPIGSVIILKNGTKKLMIIGHGQIDLSKKDKINDYIACPYPSGILENQKNIIFNHEDIKNILALGYSDIENTLYIKKINNLINDKYKVEEILNNIN